MILEIEVTYIGGQFHGEEWEWPPSPARLFQALIAATHHGAHGLFHQAVRDAALRWLEELPPPVIAACSAVYGSDNVENYVPNNDDGIGVNAHIRTAKSLAVYTVLDGGAVAFRWRFDTNPEAELNADVIVAMASLLTRLGRSTDSVYARGRIADDNNEELGRTIYYPADTPRGRWRAPAPGFFALCQQRFPRSISTAPPDFGNSRQIEYAAERPEAVRALPIAFFEMLRTDGESKLPFDPRHLRQPAGMVRYAMIEWADRTSGLQDYFGSDRLARFIRGHKAADSGEPSQGGHFAVVPLPSMNAGFSADGWIRRVAILGYGVETREEGELFDELCRGLHGSALKDGGRPIGQLRRLTGDAVTRGLHSWKRSGKRWRTVTPLILTGRFRRGRSAEDCLLRALAQQGFSIDQIESVATYSGPIVPKTLPARAYHVQGYLSTTARVHAEVIFRKSVTGPLVVGRGRFAGFGLFIPADEE
jgi:CRISPR-associated protein Csb2